MNWLLKNNPFESDRDRYDSGYNSYAPPQYMPATHSTSLAPERSMHHDREYEAPEIFRTYSSSRRMADPPAYDRYHNYDEQYGNYGERYDNNGDRYNQSENLFRTTSNSYDFNAMQTTAMTEPAHTANEEVTEASEEVLVHIPGAMVHLIDDKESPLLGDGDFSIVRVQQDGNGIVVLVRVGDQLRWPLTKDEPAVKLNATHYFFTIKVPHAVDDMDKETARGGGEMLSYGVTFSVSGHERELRELDKLLDRYSSFSSPRLVHGDRQKREFDGALNSGADRMPGGMVVPEEVVSSDGKKVTEGNQAEFWRTMAPNVDDYNSRIAKSMAKGTGQIIKGIFWVRDSTVTRLENGSLYAKGKIKPSSKSSSISPRTLQNLKRVRNMSVATESVAKSVLEGVVKTVGFFSGALMTSKAGKKFFRLLPGEVALVSMDAFAKIFDAVEKAGTDILQSTSMYTQDVVSHRYGQEAGQVTQNTLSTAGHLFGTAWTVSKVRRALNPSKFRVSKTGMLKAAAKAAVGGRSK